MERCRLSAAWCAVPSRQRSDDDGVILQCHLAVSGMNIHVAVVIAHASGRHQVPAASVARRKWSHRARWCWQGI